jgi:hypothetical protein
MMNYVRVSHPPARELLEEELEKLALLTVGQEAGLYDRLTVAEDLDGG